MKQLLLAIAVAASLFSGAAFAQSVVSLPVNPVILPTPVQVVAPLPVAEPKASKAKGTPVKAGSKAVGKKAMVVTKKTAVQRKASHAGKKRR